MRLVATRAGWRPNAVEIFAIAPTPEEEAAEYEARVRHYERFAADFLAVAELATAPDG